ncbi:hypothetical protein CVT26_006888 [Gymnopilus dilepis]|uniref:Uncharacterized protein n=1 Tax=Gymnopilus dilepis TaxID=231916 RepID=A0A409W0X0_9AGAR|nr:hypothetical protein CVT26_006888 [Gymnopilus dilepis]
MTSLVWLITGASSGLGYELAQQALLRSEKVIATGRSGKSFTNLDGLKAQGAQIRELDVTSPLETLREVAREAVEIYGRIDVLVNNAGYVCNGTIEETTPQETYDQFNTNLFGAINVVRAFLPYMRDKKSGTLVWISSLYGVVSGPYWGNYIGTKWAMRGISRSIHEEISSLGLRSICIEYGHTRSPVLEPGRRKPKGLAIPDYEDIVSCHEANAQAMNGKQPGDPVKCTQAIIDTVRGEGAATGKYGNHDCQASEGVAKHPRQSLPFDVDMSAAFPPDLLLGSDSYRIASEAKKNDLEVFEEWKDVTCGVDLSSEFNPVSVDDYRL